MKTNKDVLDYIYTLLDVDETVIRNRYREGYNEDKFYVINTLGTPKDSIQTVDINVNAYARDFHGGVMDEATLNTMALQAITKINGFRWFENTKVYIEYTHMMPVEAGEWTYMNLRFKLTFLNN